MRTTTLANLLLVLASASGLAADQALPVGEDFGPHDTAPEAWNQQDPADGLYRQAREAMNGGDYERAADLFRSIWQRHPRSTYAADAPYWEAFNRYRGGETRDLERALASLGVQEQRYAEAATRKSGDAAALTARINGMLARRGDAASAQAVLEHARMAAEMGRAMAEELAPVAAEAGRAAAAAAAAATAVSGAHGPRAADVPPQCREQVEIQVAALNALLHMKSETAMPALTQVMARRDECAPPLRRRAVFMIAHQGGPEGVDVLLGAARNDPDMGVRRDAVFWLSETKDARAVTALTQFATAPGDEQLRDRAIFALAQHRDPAARQALRRIAQDEATPAALRGRAVFWLGQHGAPDDVAFVRGLFGRTGNASVDDQILFAVAQAKGAENASWLLSVAGNDRVPMDLRRKAVFWASEAGAPTRELGTLYDRAQDRELKERVLFALSHSRQPEAVDKLIQVVRTERDPELRKRALFWLGNSSDPKAAQAILELLQVQ